MNERELGNAIMAAARAATDACLARGYSRSDPVTIASAKAAGDEVYLRERGAHDSAERIERAPVPPPVAAESDPEQKEYPHVDDPMKSRIDRDEEPW